MQAVFHINEVMEKWARTGFNFDQQAIGYTSQARDHTYKLLAEAINRCLVGTAVKGKVLKRSRSAHSVGNSETLANAPFLQDQSKKEALKKITSGELLK